VRALPSRRTRTLLRRDRARLSLAARASVARVFRGRGDGPPARTAGQAERDARVFPIVRLPVSITERTYAASPTWLQHAMVSAFGWRWRRLRLGGQWPAFTRDYRDREGWSRGQ